MLKRRVAAVASALSAAALTFMLVSCGGGGGSASAMPAVAGVSAATVTTGASPANTIISIYGAAPSLNALPGVAPAAFPPSLTDAQSTGTLALSDNFESGAGQWTPTLGTWSICQPANSNHEYCSVSSTAGVALALAGESTLADTRVESYVRFANDSGGAAVLSRVVDASHFYEFELREYNGLKSWFLWVNDGGVWTELAGGGYPYVINTYYRLRLDSVGTGLAASISTDGVNFTLLGTASDQHFARGAVGLRSWGAADASFDNVAVTAFTNATPIPLPSASIAPTLSPAPSALPSLSPVPSGVPTPPIANFAITLPQVTGANAAQNVPVGQSIRLSTAGQADSIVDISPTSSACLTIGANRTCQGSIPSAFGAQTFTVTAYDAANGSGNVLAQSTHIATLVSGQNSNIPVTYVNVPTSVVYTLQTNLAVGNINGLQTPLGVAVADIGGNFIASNTAFVNPNGLAENVVLTQDDVAGKTSISPAAISMPLTGNATLTETGHVTTPIHLLAQLQTQALAVRGTTALAVVTPSNNYTFTLGPEQTVPASVPAGMDGYRAYFADAHFSVIPEPSGGCSMMWGIAENWKSTGPDCYPQDQGAATLVWHPFQTGTEPVWESNGDWMLSWYRQSAGNIITFFHAENGNDPIAYEKTLGVVYSTNDGASFQNEARIFMPQVTPNPGPTATKNPSSLTDGDGDGVVIWDWFNNRWFGMANENSVNTAGQYVANGTMIAQSTDPNAAPGTWYKMLNGAYTSPGLGGAATYILNYGYFYANPSLTWNTYLGEWVAVNDGSIFGITTSQTLNDWTKPISSVMTAPGTDYFMYPTMMGVDDKVGGQTMTLYYSHFYGSGGRSFCYRTITFHRQD